VITTPNPATIDCDDAIDGINAIREKRMNFKKIVLV
jgi:hypothetical protein